MLVQPGKPSSISSCELVSENRLRASGKDRRVQMAVKSYMSPVNWNSGCYKTAPPRMFVKLRTADMVLFWVHWWCIIELHCRTNTATSKQKNMKQCVFLCSSLSSFHMASQCHAVANLLLHVTRRDFTTSSSNNDWNHARLFLNQAV